jgi:hypothetical protein
MARAPEMAGQMPRRAQVGHEAEPRREGEDEARRLGGKHDIGRQRQPHPAAGRHAVHRRDGRERRIAQVEDQPVHEATQRLGASPGPLLARQVPAHHRI